MNNTYNPNKVPSKPKQRSQAQNRALHKYCTELATELNNAGVGIDVFFKNVEADHTMESVKSLWRGFAKVKYGRDSTAQLTTSELNNVYEEVNRHIAQFGIHMAFPSQENSPNALKSYEN